MIKKKKNPGLKFNPRLALTGVRTTGPRNENKNGEFSLYRDKNYILARAKREALVYIYNSNQTVNS